MMITLNRSFLAASLLVLTANVLANKPYTELESLSQHETLINNGLSIVEYYADWCSACKMMQPDFEAAAQKNSTVSFAKANLDKEETLKTLVKKLNIQAYPTIILYKNGKEAERFRGSLTEPVIQGIIDRATETQAPVAAPAPRAPERCARPVAPVTRQAPVAPQPRRRVVQTAPKVVVQPQVIKVAQRPAVVKTSTFRRS